MNLLGILYLNEQITDKRLKTMKSEREKTDLVLVEFLLLVLLAQATKLNQNKILKQFSLIWHRLSVV